MTTGERIRQTRKALNLSQRELSKRASCAINSIGFYERGEREVGVDTLKRIASALNVPVGFLLETETIPTTNIENLRKAARMVDMCAYVARKSISELQDELREFLTMLDNE